ncbi:MAG: hypothetical protein IH898_14015 [Planctomycetes bacterium]|nr:hypothetical protein [Planctomycetota bacterium]
MKTISVDVFDGSIIRKKLVSGIGRRIERIRAGVEEGGYEYDRAFQDLAVDYWVNTIRRILLRARSFGHGGAFLLTDADPADRLKKKYALHYERIPVLFENWMTGRCLHRKSFDLLRKQLNEHPDHLEPKLCFDHISYQNAADDAAEAMSGAAGFVAALSRVDGLNDRA